jgi:hypothetical protein
LLEELDMRKHLRHHVAALCLLAPAAITLTAMPATALAQAATPEVIGLQVNSDNGINPGSRLHFRLEGSPHAQAFVRLEGVRGPIALREVERGVYVGNYVIARGDRIDDGDQIRATIRRGNRTVTANYDIPPGLRNVAAALPPPPPLHIGRFEASALDRIEPGNDIHFVVEGIPGGTAFVELPGVAGRVQLHEERPGHYEGRYTIRRADRIDPRGPVVATLRAGDRVVTANLDRPLVAADNRPPAIRELSPREGEVIQGSPHTVVSARFDDEGGSGVDPRSVRVVISGRNVTADTDVTPASFTFRGPLPPGRQTVDVTARDRAGNVVRRTWSFDVAEAAPVNVPIVILNQSNNAQIDGNVGHVRGRTAPFATVNVRVDAVPPVVGQFGVAQQLLERTMQADARGNFEFSFTSPFPVPGTRYDVQMVARKADITTESRLTLFQRQG